MGLILRIKYMLDVQNFCGCVTFSPNKFNELKSHIDLKLSEVQDRDPSETKICTVTKQTGSD